MVFSAVAIAIVALIADCRTTLGDGPRENGPKPRLALFSAVGILPCLDDSDEELPPRPPAVVAGCTRAEKSSPLSIPLLYSDALVSPIDLLQTATHEPLGRSALEIPAGRLPLGCRLRI